MALQWQLSLCLDMCWAFPEAYSQYCEVESFLKEGFIHGAEHKKNVKASVFFVFSP